MAALVIDNAFKQRGIAREAKAAAEEAMSQMQRQQIGDMRNAADERYLASKWDAVAQIGGGVVSIGSAGLGAHQEAGGFEVDGAALGAAGKFGGDVVKGGVKLGISSGESHDADMDEASAKEAEHAADTMKTVADNWRDDVHDAQDMVRKALEFLKDYKNAQAQSMSAAMRRA